MQFLNFTDSKILPGGQTYKQARFRCPVCGKEHVCGYYNGLKAKSCGCIPPRFTHRLKKHPLYAVWESMRKRCNTPTEPAYPRYGGRGIKVCAEWDSFPLFLEWATSAGWQKGLLIDRIDNDKGYSPDNCRFVTDAVSSQNRRSTKLSAQIVTDIRAALESGESSKSIRQRFGITSVDLYAIKTRKKWRNI